LLSAKVLRKPPARTLDPERIHGIDYHAWRNALRYRNVPLAILSMLCWLGCNIVVAALFPSYLVDHLGPDGLAEQRHRQWARATRESFNATALPGGYPNLLTGDDSDRVARSYGPNAERLIKVKRRYDPDNVFCSAIPLPVTSARAGGHDTLVDATE
jgi:hypothetical protein